MSEPIIAFRFAADDRALLEAIARTLRVGKTEALRQCVRFYAEQHEVKIAPVDRQHATRKQKPEAPRRTK